MGRLGEHPHIVTVYDMGEEDGQPYLVSRMMAAAMSARLIATAPEHRLPLDDAFRSPTRSAARWSTRTRTASSTATSSRATSGSPPTAPPSWATSAWRWRSTARG